MVGGMPKEDFRKKIAYRNIVSSRRNLAFRFRRLCTLCTLLGTIDRQRSPPHPQHSEVFGFRNCSSPLCWFSFSFSALSFGVLILLFTPPPPSLSQSVTPSYTHRTPTHVSSIMSVRANAWSTNTDPIPDMSLSHRSNSIPRKSKPFDLPAYLLALCRIDLDWILKGFVIKEFAAEASFGWLLCLGRFLKTAYLGDLHSQLSWNYVLLIITGTNCLGRNTPSTLLAAGSISISMNWFGAWVSASFTLPRALSVLYSCVELCSKPNLEFWLTSTSRQHPARATLSQESTDWHLVS